MDKSYKINTILIFSLFLILLINLNFQLLDSEWTLLLFLIPMIIFYFLRIDSRFFIIFAIFFLIYSAITLAFLDNKDYANLIAINAYYGLVAGVVLQLIEYVKKRDNLFYVKEMGFILFNLPKNNIRLPKSNIQLSKTPVFVPVHYNKPLNLSLFLKNNIKSILAMTLVFAVFEIITGYLYLTKQTAFTNYDILFFLSSLLFFPFLIISLISLILKRKH
ncbi:MAG: hypothetical protein WC356_07550 [Candidatus Micrarchaeia archaeon]|jgi:hypothetical protein